ncbi:MAG: hypothetical protein WCK09_22300, partial [Bacteroidota bacterium]
MIRHTLLTVLFLIFSAGASVFSQTITSAPAGGNWNSTATWIGGVIPGPGNDVVIASGGNNVTVTVAAGCANLTIGSGSTRGRLYHNSGTELTVNGTVTMTQGTGFENRWRINAGSATVAGLISFPGSSTNTSNTAAITITSGVLNANGGISFTSSAAITKIIDMSGGTGTLNLKGALTTPATSSTLTTLTTGSIFNYTDVNPQTIFFFSSGTYENLYINNTSASGATISAAITAANVTGNIVVGNINTGSFFSTGNFNIGMTSSKTLTVSANSTMDAGTSIISFPATPGSATINGTFKTANTNGFSGATTTAINSNNNPAITLGTTSTIEFNAAGTQKVTNRTYAGNVVLTGATKTIGTAVSQTVTIGKNFTINGGATYEGSTYDPVLSVGGNFSNSGIFVQGVSLVSFNGATIQNIMGSTATTFSNGVTLSNPAGLSITTSPTILGTLTFASGKITTGTNKVILGVSATAIGAGAGKYVFGNLEMYIPNTVAPSVNFFVGDAANYT